MGSIEAHSVCLAALRRDEVRYSELFRSLISGDVTDVSVLWELLEDVRKMQRHALPIRRRLHREGASSQRRGQTQMVASHHVQVLQRWSVKSSENPSQNGRETGVRDSSTLGLFEEDADPLLYLGQTI